MGCTCPALTALPSRHLPSYPHPLCTLPAPPLPASPRPLCAAPHLFHHKAAQIDRAFDLHLVRQVSPLRKLSLCALANVRQTGWIIGTHRDDAAVEVADLYVTLSVRLSALLRRSGVATKRAPVGALPEESKALFLLFLLRPPPLLSFFLSFGPPPRFAAPCACLVA